MSRLAREDQADRKHFFRDPDRVTKNDRVRRAEVAGLLRTNHIRTAVDYLNAALIFQHGLALSDYKRAQMLAREAERRGGGERARWLYAVATDRLLIAQGRKQKYGSQLSIVRAVDRRTGRPRRTMKLLPYDKRTADATRTQFGLPTLAILLKMDGSRPPVRQKKIRFRSE